MANWQRIAILLLIAIVVLFVINHIKSQKVPGLKKAYVAGNLVFVKIAQTSADKKQGLSGVKKLDKNEGMLFVLADKQKPVFWMKDMNFALDAIWISNNKVVDLTENIAAPLADTSDKQIVRFAPEAEVDMVLELNAGWIKEKNVKIGDEFSIEPETKKPF